MADQVSTGPNNLFSLTPQLTPEMPQMFIPQSIPQSISTMFSGTGSQFGQVFSQSLDPLSQTIDGLSKDIDKIMRQSIHDMLPTNNTQIPNVDINTPDVSETETNERYPLPKEGKPTKEDKLPDEFKGKNADEIIKTSKFASNLGNQKGDIQELKKDWKARIGDWENEPDPELRAKSAAKWAQVCEHVGHMDSYKGNPIEPSKDGRFSGLTKDNQIRSGTQLAALKDGGKYGIDHLKEQNGRLAKTNDRYVREDGTTRSDAGQAFVDLGQGISHVLPGLGNVIKGAADGADQGGFNGMMKGGFKAGISTMNQGLNMDVNGLFSGGYDPSAL